LDELSNTYAALSLEGATQEFPVDFVVRQEQVGGCEGMVGWGWKGFDDAVIFGVRELVHLIL
jgi:hypothetical protein